MTRVLAVLGAGAVLIGWAAWQPQARTSSTVMADDVKTLLIRFGVNDKEPENWDGGLSVAGGQIVRLSSWRTLPGDAVNGQQSWKLSSTWSERFQNRPWEREPMTPYAPYLRRPGLVVEVRGASPVLTIRTAQGQFDTGLTGGAFLNGRVAVQPAASPIRLSADDSENEHVTLARGSGQDMWFGWVAYRRGATQAHVRRHDGKQWTVAEPLTGSSDVFRVQVGFGSKSGVWAVWNEQVDGNWDLYGRRREGSRWGPTQRLTEAAQPDIHHALAVGSPGTELEFAL